jgi:hypothetical protein
LDVNTIAPGQAADVFVPLTADGDEGPVSPVIHVAVKNNIDVFYFLAECPVHVFLSPDGALEKPAYLAAWKDIPDTSERTHQLAGLVSADPNTLSDILQRNNIFLIHKRRVNEAEVLYLSARVVLPSKALTTGGEVILVELTLSGMAAKCCIRTNALELVPLFQASISTLISRGSMMSL